MKKVLTILVIFLLIGVAGSGFYFRQNIFDFINDKVGDGDTIVMDTYNMENNSSIKPFLDLQKSLLSKKDYKNFLNNINQQVTYNLKELNKILPGYDSLDNVLFIETEHNKTIDFINMNTYDDRLESSYHAFIWIPQPNDINPTWNGFFQEDDTLIDNIKFIINEPKEQETESNIEESKEDEMTLSKFQATKEYTEIISMLNDEVELEDKVVISMKSTFGNNYAVVENLINEAKKSITLNVTSANMLGESDYGIGYAGKVVNDTFCILTGPLKEDNTIGDTKYLLFRINTNGEYDDYSNGIIILSELISKEELPEVVLPPKEQKDTEEESTEGTTVEETEATTIADQVKESVAETTQPVVDETKESTPKKSPIDLFDEIMSSSAVEESTVANED